MADPKKPQTQMQKAPNKGMVLAQAIESRRASLAAVATKYLPADRLIKLTQAAIAKTPLLAECEVGSVLVELMACSRLGLEPNEPGGRWLVPFKNNKTGRYECQGITDYRGLIDIARRSGAVLAVHADVVREGDRFEYGVDTTSPTLVKLIHVPAEGEAGDVIGAYAVVKLKSGEAQAVWLSNEKINSYRRRSRGSDNDSSPWNRDLDAMRIKTALRRLYNLLPKTPEIQAAQEVLAQEETGEAPAIDVTAGLPPASSSDPHQAEKDAVKAKAKALADAAEDNATVTDGGGVAEEQQTTTNQEPAQEDIPGWGKGGK